MKHRIIIRLATVPEKPELEALFRRASLSIEADREFLMTHPEVFEIPAEQLEGEHAFVAERDGALIGFSIVLPRDDGNAELDGIFVEPDAWRAGVGTTLIEASCKRAKDKGVSFLHVKANPAAEGFYIATGFEHLGAYKTQFGTGFFMRKKI